MTRQEMLDTLKAAGVKKAFKPYREEGRVMPGSFLLKTRPPFNIVDGWLIGGEIVYSNGDFRVWTPKTRLAKRIATSYGLRIHEFDGESELNIPASLADALLPQFGAVVKRQVSAAQKAVLKARLSRKKP